MIERSNSNLLSFWAYKLIPPFLSAKRLTDVTWILDLTLRPVTRFYTIPNDDFLNFSELADADEVSHTPRLRTEVAFDDQSVDYRVRSIFTDSLIPNIQACGPAVMGLLTRKLHEVRAVRARTSSESFGSSFERAAIEEHSQDEYRNSPENLLVDLLRDSWEALLVVDVPTAIEVLEQWNGNPDNLIQRLVIHATRRLVEARHVI